MLKKLIFITGMVILLCLTFSLSGFGANLLDNGSFESGTTGWKPESAGFSISNSESHSGNSSLRLGNGGYTSGWFLKSPNPKLEAGRKYLFSVWYKVKYTGSGEMPVINANGYNSFLLYIRSNIGGSDMNYLNGVTGGTLIRDGEWHQFTFTFTPVAGNTEITNFAVRDYNIVDGMEYYFDDFDLRLAEPSAIQNESFEDPSMAPWQLSSGASCFSISTDEKNVGQSSLKLTGTDNQAYISQTISVAQNNSYEISFMSKGNAGGKVQICNSSGVAYEISVPVLTEDSDWENYKIYYTSAANTNIMIKISDTLNGVRYFDDFKISAFSGIGAETEFTSNNAVTLSVTNYTNSPKAVYAVLGAYDIASGLMSAYDTKEVTLSAMENQSFGLLVPASTGKKYMAFLWDGYDTMKPVSAIYTPDGILTDTRNISGTGINVSADLQGNITIYGGLGSMSNTNVGSIKITKSGFSSADDNVLIYAFPVGQNGGYSISLKLPQSYPSGTYNITVRGVEAAPIQTSTFYFINQGTISGIVNAMNGISGSAQMLSYITGDNNENLTLMGLDFTLFNTLSEAEKTEICDILIRAKNADISENNGYGGFLGDTLKDKFYDAVCVFEFYGNINSASVGSKYAVAEENLQNIGAEIEIGSIYASLDNTWNKKAIDNVLSIKFMRTKDIILEFHKESAIALINSANKSAMRHYILNSGLLSDKLSVTLGLDRNKLSGFSDMKLDTIFESLSAVEYTTVSGFITAVDRAITNSGGNSVVTRPSTGGGGGGGGGGSSYVITKEPQKQEPEPEPLKGNITWGEVFELFKKLGFTPNMNIPDATKETETPFTRDMVYKLLVSRQ